MKKKEGTDPGTVALTVATQAGAAAVMTGSGPLEAAVVAAAATMLTFAATWKSDRSKRRWGAFVHEYVRASDPDAAHLEGRLRDDGKDPNVQEAVVEAARSSLHPRPRQCLESRGVFASNELPQHVGSRQTIASAIARSIFASRSVIRMFKRLSRSIT
jgi:hypothetical protein